VRYTARIDINGFRFRGSSIRIAQSLPLAMSSSTMNRGMLPPQEWGNGSMIYGLF